MRQAGAPLHHGARPSHYRGLSCCGAQAPDVQAQQLWLTGLVTPRHVGSSQTRAQTRVPCIGRQIPNHCATREAYLVFCLNKLLKFLICLCLCFNSSLTLNSIDQKIHNFVRVKIILQRPDSNANNSCPLSVQISSVMEKIIPKFIIYCLVGH